jgi:hypothetical protein
MTERMQGYRKRMEEKGLVQVRIWVEKQDEEFVKYLAKFCRDGREKKEKKRFGRRASDRQVQFAKAIASANNISEPNHCTIIILASLPRHGVMGLASRMN